MDVLGHDHDAMEPVRQFVVVQAALQDEWRSPPRSAALHKTLAAEVGGATQNPVG